MCPNYVYGSQYADTITPAVNTAGFTKSTAGDDIIFADFEAPGGADYIDAGGGNDEIIAAAGNDTVIGGAGNDKILGGQEDDSLIGGTGNDLIFGEAGDDSLIGGDGEDILSGEFGRDTYYGGAGADSFDLTEETPDITFDVGSTVAALDFVADFGSADGDKLAIFPVYRAYLPAPGIEYGLTWHGATSAVSALTPGLRLPALPMAWSISVFWVPKVGGDGWVVADLDQDGILDATDFAALVRTTDGKAIEAADFIVGTFAAAPPLSIGGTAGDDRITPTGVSAGVTGGAPGAGADRIITGAGRDSIVAGAGDDAVDAGDGADSLSGGEGADTLFGGAGADTLYGGAGEDVLQGGRDNDTYILDATFDVVVELDGQGVDTLRVPFGGLTLMANVENAVATTSIAHSFTGNDLANVLTGNAGADTLNGAAGNDTLNGGAGEDVLEGGLGNDHYVLDTPFDQVIELEGEGIDTVRVAFWQGLLLAPNVENAIAITRGDHTLWGNELANRLVGNADWDFLEGQDGNDTLDGGGGLDELVGGRGDDVYIVDRAVDVVTEIADQGVDSVRTTSANFTLPANVENLIGANGIAHLLIGNALDNVITGNAGADTLQGAAGNDTLDGAAGIDRLAGGTGDDVYRIEATDVVVEAVNAGTDRVVVLSGTGYTLTANVENLVLSGATLLNGTGNWLANAITGNANANILQGLGGNDTILGGGGNDTILGGGGQDVLTGGAGNDHFRFTARADSALATPDRITDFTAGADRIDLRLLDGNAATPLAFVAGAPTGAGQVGVVSRGGTAWQVQVDLDGGGADVAINLTSATGPAANWFLL